MEHTPENEKQSVMLYLSVLKTVRGTVDLQIRRANLFYIKYIYFQKLLCGNTNLLTTLCLY